MILGVIAFAVLSGPVPKVGAIVVALFAAGVLTLPSRRPRAVAMLGALVLAPVLLVASLWDDSKLRIVHDHPLVGVVLAAVGVLVVCAAAVWLRRRPQWFGVLAVLTLPFRVPITSGGTTSNLLVPLYVVIGVGGVASLITALHRERSPYRTRREATEAEAEQTDRARTRRPAARPEGADPAVVAWLGRLLAVALVLYAVQSVYSDDFQAALQNLVFFYVPFALLYRLLRELRWTPELVRACLCTAVALALVFSLIGFYEYATKTILLNQKLATTNDLHAYFTVNSLFFDPDIFGRFLALTMILLAAGLLYGRAGRALAASVAALAVTWACLVLTLSRSSLGALLVGMAVLAALRWKASRALVAVVAVIVVGAIAVAATPHTFGLEQGVNGVSSGRGGLVSGGISLFSERPLYGYGSGSFIDEYRAHHHNVNTTLSASHTIPITIAAEQGVIGLVVYVALVLCAVMTLTRGARGDPLRSALAAAFVALVFHTLLYADFLEDPTTWALLGVGAALAAVPRREREREREQRLARASAAADAAGAQSGVV